MDKKGHYITELMKYRMPYHNKNLPFTLLWSEKSGCTSLAKWYFYQMDLLNKALSYHPFIHQYICNVHCNHENYITELKEDFFKKEIIKLVRNPYSRAVSSYLHVLHYGTPNEKRNEKFSRDLEGVYLQNQISGMSFKQFLFCIEKSGSYSNAIDGHVAQQYIKGEELWINKIIRLEDFKKEIRTLENQYNLKDSPINQLIKSPHHKSQLNKEHLNNKNFSEKILTKDMLTTINLPVYKNFYDKESLDLCSSLFEKDIEMYNYKNL